MGVFLDGEGDSGRKVADDHLHYLDLSEEASGRWEEGADGILKLLPILEEDVGGGGGDECR